MLVGLAKMVKPINMMIETELEKTPSFRTDNNKTVPSALHDSKRFLAGNTFLTDEEFDVFLV